MVLIMAAVSKIEIWAKILVLCLLRHGFRFEVEGFHEYYWEIGISRETLRRNIRKILSKYFRVEKEFSKLDKMCC